VQIFLRYGAKKGKKVQYFVQFVKFFPEIFTKPGKTLHLVVIPCCKMKYFCVQRTVSKTVLQNL